MLATHLYRQAHIYTVGYASGTSLTSSDECLKKNPELCQDLRHSTGSNMSFYVALNKMMIMKNMTVYGL